MKSYHQLKPEMEEIHQKMVQAKKNECVNLLREVKRPCKEFVFSSDMLKVLLAKGSKKK